METLFIHQQELEGKLTGLKNDLATTQTNLLNLVPTGTIWPYSGSSCPNNWVFCDGAAVPRTGSFHNLYTVIGDRYGAGDGSTTFNLPNLSGRVPIGVSGSHGLATSGGAETVQLTMDHMPNHDHRFSDPGHSHLIRHGEALRYGAQAHHRSDYTHDTTIRTEPSVTGIHFEAQGGNVAHPNMQPFLTVNYIIKL